MLLLLLLFCEIEFNSKNFPQKLLGKVRDSTDFLDLSCGFTSDFVTVFKLVVTINGYSYNLAEFIIMLAGKSKNDEKFKKYLKKNGADFPVRN